MGCGFSKYDEAVVTVPPCPIWTVEQRFCFPNPVTLMMKEKLLSFSGDDFTIKDPYTNIEYFKIQGKVFSLRQKKTLLDVYGTPVWNMKSRLFSIPAKFNIFFGNNSDQLLYRLDSKCRCSPYIKVKFLNKATNEPCEAGIIGDWLSRRCIIWLDVGCKGKENRVIVAKVSMELLTLKNMFFNKQDYFVQVAPNVDLALITSMVLAVDELQNDDKRNSGPGLTINI